MPVFEANVRILTVFCFSLALNGATLPAQRPEPNGGANAPELLPPYKTVAYSFQDKADATTPYLSHGYLIQFKRLSTFAGESNIYLYGSSGNLEHEVAIWPLRATKLLITSVDVGASLQLVLAGQTAMADGSRSYFIATSDLDGKGAKYFSTGNYRAAQISQADDGSIWAVGAEHYQMEAGGSAPPLKWKNYDMLRHYSSAGTMVEHFLPRWGSRAAYVIQQVDASNSVTLRAYDSQNNPVAEYAAPLWGPQGGYAEASAVASQSWLKAVGNGVLLYDGRSGVIFRHIASQAFMSSNGVEPEDSQGGHLNGFAVTSDGRIFAAMSMDAGAGFLDRGLFELVPNPPTGLWRWFRVGTDLTLQLSLGSNFSVLGADGTAIVSRMAGNQVGWSHVTSANMEKTGQERLR
jgi:hypothetical protein